MAVAHYTVDAFPSGLPVSGKCPRCRRVLPLSRYYIRVTLAFDSQSTVAGTVFECSNCSIRLTDTGVIGRLLRVLLLLACLAGIAAAATLVTPWIFEFFKHPGDVEMKLWVMALALVSVMGGATWAFVRSLRSLFVSRFVETKGIETGV